MIFLKVKTAWTNPELGLIKLCLAAFWIAAGAYFHEQVNAYIPIFLTLFFITAVWTFLLWIKKMKQ